MKNRQFILGIIILVIGTVVIYDCITCLSSGKHELTNYLGLIIGIYTQSNGYDLIKKSITNDSE